MKRTKTVFGAAFIGVFAVFIVILISAFATLAQAEEAMPTAQDARPICGCDFAACYQDPEQCKRGNAMADDDKGAKGGSGKGNG